MRDNLNKYIIYDKYFPSNPQKAIANGFIYAEKIFFKNYTGLDSSGSCAIVVLIVENRVYIANVGDSRAILSAKNGSKFYPLSRDHRPGDEKEYKRILDAGGKIYKTEYEYGNNDVSNKTWINFVIIWYTILVYNFLERICKIINTYICWSRHSIIFNVYKNYIIISVI